jgi:hypothetical protein
MRATLIVGFAIVVYATAFVPVWCYAAADAPPGFTYSTDPAVGAEQRAAYAFVHQYEQYLNAGDTAGILDLFAPQSVAEWNDQPTFATPREEAAG